MESLHYLLMKTHTILNRQILNCAGKAGLTAGQPKVLEFLSQHGESDQKTIASYCEIEPATVGSILLRMERPAWSSGSSTRETAAPCSCR